jgi:hypothetical protein
MSNRFYDEPNELGVTPARPFTRPSYARSEPMQNPHYRTPEQEHSDREARERRMAEERRIDRRGR